MSRIAAAARREDGQTMVLVAAVMFVVLLGITGLVIDVGRAYQTKRKLQATADAAATAAAFDLPSVATATATAATYGPGGLNPAGGGITATQTASAWCLKSLTYCYGGTAGTAVPTTATSQANGLVVTESAQVPTMFMRLFGIKSWNVSAKAVACGACGRSPLNIALVIDRTGSMADNLGDLRAGLGTFGQSLDPSLDWISLLVLPPAPAGSACTAANGGSSSAFPRSGGSAYPTSADDDYVVVSQSHDYLNADGSINYNSRLVQQIGCISAAGPTSYERALEAAKAELDAYPSSRQGYQDVIIFESDGAANIASDSDYNGSSGQTAGYPYKLYNPASGRSQEVLQPCQSAVDEAASLKSQGVLILTVGYQVDQDDDCYQSPHITGSFTSWGTTYYTGVGYKDARENLEASTALAEIASPNDAYTARDAGTMSAAFAGIASKLAGAILVPNSEAG